MSRGRRYDTEPKLNIKKVFAVIIAILVVIMFIFIIKGIVTKDDVTGKVTSKSYFTAFKDNKWGVIDNSGNNIIDPSYKEMIVIPDSKMGVFICTYDINYETGEYKTKALNEKNEPIFMQYEQVEAISNKDKNDNLWYESNVLKIKKDGKYGMIDLLGNEILPIQYEEIQAILGTKNLFKVKKDEKYGVTNNEGKIIIDAQYSDIDVLGEDKVGFIIKNDEGKYGLIDYSRSQILETKYDSIQNVYGNDLYVVTEAGKQKIVNKENKDVLTTGFDSIEEILTSQENAIIFVKKGKYGVMNLSGEILINPEYDKLEKAKNETFIAKKADKYGIINISKEEKIPFEYSSIVYNKKADIYVLEDSNYNSTILNNNLETKVSGILLELNETKGYIKLRVEDIYKYYNFKFEEKKESDIFPNKTLFLDKKDSKYGYVDKDGKIIVDYIYDDAIEQNDYGYSAVKKDGKWGSIDAKGSIAQEPIYNLDEYLLIDFIGRWHLGLDVNMNYYNQL